MPDNTRADFVKQTEVKTELLPVSTSEETALHGGAGGQAAATNVIAAHFTSVPAPKRRGLAPAVVGLGLLLVAGLAAGGVYIAKPSMFSGQKEVEKAPDTVATVPTAANANGSAVSNSNATPAGSAPAGSTAAQVANAEAPPKVETSRPTENVTKPTETTKNKTPNPPDRPNTVDDPALNNLHGPPDEVVVTQRNPNGTTTRIFTNPNGRRMPNGQRPPDIMVPMPNGIDMKSLTPKQRQQIKAYMRNHGGQPPPGIPKP